MYSVHSAGKTRNTPMSTSAGATNPTARSRPSPATSVGVEMPTPTYCGTAAATGAPATAGCAGIAACWRVSAGGNLVRPADESSDRLLVRRRRVRGALAADHVKRGLLQCLGHLRIHREAGTERGQRQHLLRDEGQHRVTGQHLAVDILTLRDLGGAAQIGDHRVLRVHELQQFPCLLRVLGRRVDDVAAATRHGHEVLAADPAAGLHRRNLRPPDHLVAVGHFVDTLGRFDHRAPEVVALQQDGYLARGELGEGLVTTLGVLLQDGVTQATLVDLVVHREDIAHGLRVALPLAVGPDLLTGPDQQRQRALHRGGLAHRGTAVELDRRHTRQLALERLPGGKDVVPARGLPVRRQSGLREQLLVEEQHPAVRTVGDAVLLIVVGHVGLYRLRDLGPAVPGGDLVSPDEVVQRLDVPGVGELADPDAVQRVDVRAGTGFQVQRDLALVVLVSRAGTLELHRRRATLGLLVGDEVGDDPVLDPVRALGVLAAGDPVCRDRQRELFGIRVRVRAVVAGGALA